MGNTFGHLFRITTFGESHGAGIGVIVDGCPPGLPITADEIQRELDRRRPGQSSISTPRKEPDTVEILSGVTKDGRTAGTPLAMLVRNADQRSEAYDEMAVKFRPSHADFTYTEKYGLRIAEGGGRASARETVGRVAAGALAKKILLLHSRILATAWVESVADIRMPDAESPPTESEIEANEVRCPHPETALRMIARIKEARAEGDSVGGVIKCRIHNVPTGLGEPVFDRLEADLAKAMLSLPATKGLEIGSGFAGTALTGLQHNDPFVNRDGRIRTITNNSGGVQGGITNGEDIVFRVAFKPTATVMRPQRTVDATGAECELTGKGRHDPCVLPRAAPIVEAMAALVLLDHLMRNAAQNHTFRFEA